MYKVVQRYNCFYWIYIETLLQSDGDCEKERGGGGIFTGIGYTYTHTTNTLLYTV